MRSTYRLLLLAGILAAVSVGGVAIAEDSAKPTDTSEAAEGAADGEDAVAEEIPAAKLEAGRKAFADVAKVLQSPRCMNCHPAGDRPLQTDASKPHALGISRASEEAGLSCTTCHQLQNSENVGVSSGPPGAPNWHLPPKETPMIFQGLTASELCAQLKDPAQNGGKTLEQLHEHVSKDPLVLWGWNPGGDRTKPPLDHPTFVARFKSWVESGGACPD